MTDTRSPESKRSMRKVKRFTDFIQAHIERTDPHRSVIDKEQTRRVATTAGAVLPQLYQLCDNPNEVDFRSLPDAFVLKPTQFSSKKGVYVLYRIRDRFFDLFSKRVFSQDELRADLSGIIGGSPTRIMVEELIEGENGSVQIPFDYKLYTFDSGIALIIQINRNVTPNEICILSPDFLPISRDMAMVHPKLVKGGVATTPRNHAELMHIARTVHKTLDRPFVRVDCFTTGDRVVVGELTLTPGGPYYGSMYRFSPDLDRKLGRLQSDGYARRGWSIPTVKGLPPSRAFDKKFPSPE